MKIYVRYVSGVGGWRRDQLDLELMLYEGHMSPSGSTLLRSITDLSVLGYVLENNKTIYVLREPMELHGGQVEYDSVEYNIDFLINSSNILFVEPVGKEEVDEPFVPFQYTSEEEKEKRLKKMEHIGKPR